LIAIPPAVIEVQHPLYNLILQRFVILRVVIYYWYILVNKRPLQFLALLSRNHLTREFRVLLFSLAAWDITCFNLILTSTLARSLWSMKFEISYACYQYLGCNWVTCWRNNLVLKKRERERENNINNFELFTV
jgi:hypothetical protein